jgi:hypothetical protein
MTSAGRSGGNGGSGTVILRYPVAYAITYSSGGAGSTTQVNSNTENVTTITSSGTITFNAV